MISKWDKYVVTLYWDVIEYIYLGLEKVQLLKCKDLRFIPCFIISCLHFTQISLSHCPFIFNSPLLAMLWESKEIMCLMGFLNHKTLCTSLLWIENYYWSGSPILKYLESRYYNGTLNFIISTMDALILNIKYIVILFTYKEIYSFLQLVLKSCSALDVFYFIFFC